MDKVHSRSSDLSSHTCTSSMEGKIGVFGSEMAAGTAWAVVGVCNAMVGLHPHAYHGG